ncbi:MAG TPA: glucose-6-phosphate dehydrogenase [Polyangiaceae bacterium]|jgi:glucose-6-phosphate 1-dehydrogenase|nr:glucose-6-phosphate dehydrogenase [Polyangiaceae bacterium]
MARTAEHESGIFVIFGGTGDLSKRKLLPALCRLAERGELGDSRILGLSRGGVGDDAFRKSAVDAVVEAGLSKDVAAKFAERLYDHAIGKGTPEDFRGLAQRLETVAREHNLPQNRAFYLALPPDAVPATVEGLGAAGLAKSGGWTRLVVEKPFGHDLASATELDTVLHRHFDETQIYRIDHYLGKETVQNLLVFRFANSIFESLWNRERVRAIEITVAEDLGVGTRAGYYDKSGGALRDMIQNHMTQLVTLVGMEVPVAFEASAIRYEKVKVLKSITPINLKNVVRARYAAGEINKKPVPGYLEEKDIPADSQTETFVALELGIDTWRWQGVPIYLHTGKRLAKRYTQIAVHFRDVPVSLFKNVVAGLDSPDVLVITVQPDEGFSLHFDVKTPGQPFKLARVPLEFKYKQLFPDMPEAYETLLDDVWHGDQTLFVHSEEARESWRIYTPMLENPPPLVSYPAGSMGPKEAERLTASGQGLWIPT